jgi:hypothetical protein
MIGKPLTTDPMVFPCGMSRSGTTLLTTILDSHSNISLGYELIPSPSLCQDGTLKEVMDILNSCKGDLDRCKKELNKAGRKELGLFVKRYQRVGLDAKDLGNFLVEMTRLSFGQTLSINERLYIAWRIARQKKIKFNASLYGFKLNMPSIESAYVNFPGGVFIYIIRDPRDVVDSHRAQGFQKTTEQVCVAWNNYIKSYEGFHKKHANISIVIRYEDLVSKPRDSINRIFGIMPIQVEESVFKFYDSKASIHDSNHPNKEHLKRDFFTTSISRWKKGMNSGDVEQVTSYCSEKMRQYSYL